MRKLQCQYPWVLVSLPCPTSPWQFPDLLSDIFDSLPVARSRESLLSLSPFPFPPLLGSLSPSRAGILAEPKGFGDPESVLVGPQSLSNSRGLGQEDRGMKKEK